MDVACSVSMLLVIQWQLTNRSRGGLCASRNTHTYAHRKCKMAKREVGLTAVGLLIGLVCVRLGNGYSSTEEANIQVIHQGMCFCEF